METLVTLTVFQRPYEVEKPLRKTCSKPTALCKHK